MSEDLTIATVNELPQGTHKVVNVGGKEMGIFNVNGKFFAVPNTCFHQNGPLCLGAVSGTLIADESTSWKPEWTQEGEVIVCPWHSLEFNVTSGQCIAYPQRKLPVVHLRVENGNIMFPGKE
jgi:3-phenylpropionate/trans-cinnamate dioxygenase ferredoxin subunit